MSKPHCASCSLLRLATTVAGHVPAPTHLPSMDFCISLTQANRKSDLALLQKDICREQQPLCGRFHLLRVCFPADRGRVIWVVLCYFETLLSWHRKEQSKRSRRKVTKTPTKLALEEFRNFSSIMVWNYKPGDKTTRKQRQPLEDGYQIHKYLRTETAELFQRDFTL